MARKSNFWPFLIPLVLAGLVLFAGWWWLQRYTLHGAGVRVPDLKGLFFEEALSLLEERGLGANVIDSVYADDARKGTVVLQDPEAGHEVKPGRKIYLTMNARQPKMLNMPALVNLSKRQAISTLEILGLKVKELRYKTDPCLDCVVEQLYQERPIAAEDKIRRGEAVVLVLGSGEGGERVPVPDLRGLVFAEVGSVLNMASLNVGLIVECAGCNTAADSALARVHRQMPPSTANERIAIGGAVDIWLTLDTLGLRPRTGPADTTDRP